MREKPFWVCKPRIIDRETCQCKTHENRLTFEALHANKCLTGLFDDSEKYTVCDPYWKQYMYGECDTYRGKKPDFQTVKDSDKKF